MDDKEIVRLYIRRDEKAIEETKIKYGRLCKRIALNVLGNEEDAEECENDTLLTLWNNIPPDEPEKLMAYACRVARNLALKKLESRERKKRSRSMTVSLSELEETAADTLTESMETDEEIAKHISDFLRAQSEEARNVFIRKYFYFDSVKDIARRYKLSAGKVKTLLFRTREKLKEYLRKEKIEI